jgi:hypothetical protein
VRRLKRHETINFHISLSAIFSALHHRTDTHKCCIVGVFGVFSHVSVVVCLYMRVACAVIHVMRGRSWLEDLRTDNKYTIYTLGKFVTTYPTGRSHSLDYMYKEIKSRLGLRKSALPFSQGSHLISWAIKREEEENKENHIICCLWGSGS